MNNLQAGFAAVNVTPPMGIFISGYYQDRYAEGVLDELELRALALQCGEERALLMSLDNLHLDRASCADFRKHIAETTGLSEQAIFISCTHTHTGPRYLSTSTEEIEIEYGRFLRQRMADAARFALDDLKPAKMGYGVGKAPNIAFVRRYRMKDGSVRTNPGVDNPDILEPIGTVDERVNVLRFDREGADTLVLVNFGDHPDTVGGCRISADWPGFLRKTVEKTLDNTRCVFFNGAQGDVNHINPHPRGGDLNGLKNDFDDVVRGYAHTQYMGRVVAAAVLQVYDKVQYVDVDRLRAVQKNIQVPANVPAPEELPEARRINELHLAGKDSELPYEGMLLTTVVAKAARMIRLEHGPEAFEMTLSGVAVGPVAFIGVPGEPFTGIGVGLKQAPGWEMILPCCLTNGSHGYFPMQEAYDEGGYEAGSSNFKAGVAELLIREGQKLLSELHA